MRNRGDKPRGLKRLGLIGRKIGMTQIFDGSDRIPVTVISLGPNTVVQKKTSETKDGYNALQLGFADKDHKKVSKPDQGHFKKADVKPKKFVREFRVDDASEIADFEVGSELTAEMFKDAQWIDVTGTSKGKGFAGVMKKYHMKGAKQATHGTHEQFRHVGSIGCRSTPGEVNKGKRLPGHMGQETVTVQNVKVVRVDTEKNVMLVRGSIPGSTNSIVFVRPAIKKLNKKAA